jgi:hypothetical protein
MEHDEKRDHQDVLLFETPVGVAPSPPLVLYIVSLFDVPMSAGERVDGDALLVRPPGASDASLVATVIGCRESALPSLKEQGASWSVRQISTIDGYRLRFEAN